MDLLRLPMVPRLFDKPATPPAGVLRKGKGEQGGGGLRELARKWRSRSGKEQRD